MNIPKLLQIVPYVSILLANLIYIYFFSSLNSLKWYQLFLFNFVMMALIGVFLVIKINLLLHQWLVVEGQKDKQGNITKKGLLKQKIKQLLNKSHLLDSLFLPGNQKVLLKVYFGITLIRYLTSFIPGLLMTLLTFLFFQYKDIIYPKVKPILEKLNQVVNESCWKVVENVPRYENIKSKLEANKKKND